MTKPIMISCIDCESTFEFTEGEQHFYKEKGFRHPKRCAACRKIKREGGNKKQ